MKNYVAFTQQPYLCVPTCLQMILYRRGIALPEQETIANELGLIVSEEDVHLFVRARTGERPSSGWGTQIQNERYNMQKLFDKYDWELTFKRYSDIASVEALREKLVAAQGSEDTDAMLCFDYGMLWGTKSTGGHVCVFDALDGDLVRIIDPEQNVPKRRETDIQTLFKAMDFHGAHNAAGLWIIKSNTPEGK